MIRTAANMAFCAMLLTVGCDVSPPCSSMTPFTTQVNILNGSLCSDCHITFYGDCTATLSTGIADSSRLKWKWIKGIETPLMVEIEGGGRHSQNIVYSPIYNLWIQKNPTNMQ